MMSEECTLKNAGVGKLNSPLFTPHSTLENGVGLPAEASVNKASPHDCAPQYGDIANRDSGEGWSITDAFRQFPKPQRKEIP